MLLPYLGFAFFNGALRNFLKLASSSSETAFTQAAPRVKFPGTGKLYLILAERADVSHWFEKKESSKIVVQFGSTEHRSVLTAKSKR
jgi:hypothetical protein